MVLSLSITWASVVGLVFSRQALPSVVFRTSKLSLPTLAPMEIAALKALIARTLAPQVTRNRSGPLPRAVLASLLAESFVRTENCALPIHPCPKAFACLVPP